MAGRLNDKVAIVTGAGRGLGRELSLGLSAQGASVVAADLDVLTAEETSRTIRKAGGRSIAVRVDVSDQSQTQSMASAALGEYGHLEILVNNAAIYPFSPWDEITLEQWNRVLAVNLTGTFLCARAVFPAMKAQGYGKIVNISSRTFFRGVPGQLHYVASKGGVIGLTRTLAREVGDHGIRVNAVTPGIMETEGVQELAAQGHQFASPEQLSQLCIKRTAQPEDMVGTVVFLASPDSDYITGQTINVDGGGIMH